MKKIYVLDTNVLLYDPQALTKFEDNSIIIPITVIEEIDRFKKDMNETGRNARQFSRLMDDFRKQGSLSKGLPLGDGGTLRIEIYEEHVMKRLPPELREQRGDNRILAVAVDLMENEPNVPVILVTKDTNLRIKADALGLAAQDYESDKVAIDELYSGVANLEVPAELIDRFYSQGWLQLEERLLPNQFVTLIEAANRSHSAIGRFDHLSGRMVPLQGAGKEGVWSLFPRNREQSFALDALLDDKVKIVTLVGKAGTGKTLLAIAAGLQKTAEENVYNRLLVSRPIFPMGRDLGFLPGDLEEKLSPWMQPIFDNVELLLSGHEGEKRHSKGYKELMAMGILEIEALTYIRGRSIPNQYLIVD